MRSPHQVGREARGPVDAAFPGRAEARIAASALRLAQDNPDAAAAALAPVLDSSASEIPRMWLALAFLLAAIALDALGDPDAAGNALERALDLAEPDGMLTPFLLHPVPGLLERHARHRTAHAALVAEIRGLLASGESGDGQSPREQGGLGGIAPRD